MAEITAQMVKALREQTGAGMMDCKSALTETAADMEAAIDWLRAKGLSRAAKKAGRVAAEGLIGVALADGAGAVVEVNSETDFVARNARFQTMVADIARVCLEAGGDLEKTLAGPYPGAGSTVAEQITEMIATIGENLQLRRAGGLRVAPGAVAAYVHNAVAEGLGRIGVIVALKSEGPADRLVAFGRQVAMHIAAANPMSLSVAELDPDVVARERSIYADQARQSGKPDDIVEKMVDGRMRKFHQETVLLEQTFVIDGERTVAKAVADAAKEIGSPIEISGFVRLALGEGVERDDNDFAAEVAAAAGA